MNKWKKYPNFVSTEMLKNRSLDLKNFTKETRELCQTDDAFFNVETPRAVYEKVVRWSPNSTIYIKFLDGDEWQKKWVEKKVKEDIEPIVKNMITLKFVNKNEYADVKITFNFDGYGASLIGTRCRDVSQSNPSMKLGILDFPISRMFEYNGNIYTIPDNIEMPTHNDGGVIKHEFGHVFGKMHEHQNPIDNPIQWNVPKVLKYYSSPPNSWKDDDIYNNIINKLPLSQVVATPFDPLSIMMYTIDPELTTNNIGFQKNNDYSEYDILWLKNNLLGTQIIWDKYKWYFIVGIIIFFIIVGVVVAYNSNTKKSKRKR
jgi:hypothetical protein